MGYAAPRSTPTINLQPPKTAMARSKNSRTHEGFIRKLSNGTYQGCITIDGHDIRKVLRDERGNAVKEERAAKKAWATLRAKILEDNPPSDRKASYPGRTTFERGWENYLAAESARRDLTDQLKREYSRNWRYLADFAKKNGVEYMEALTPDIAKRFQIERASKLMGSSVGKFQLQIRRIWKETMKECPLDGFEAKASQSYQHANLTDSEVSMLIQTASEYGEEKFGDPWEWQLFFSLAIQTGLRLADCARFDAFKNLDPEKGVAVVKPLKIATRIRNNRQGDGCKAVRIPLRGFVLDFAKSCREKALTVTLHGKYTMKLNEPENSAPVYIFPTIAALAKKDNGTTLNRHISAIFKRACIDTEPFEKDGQMWKKSFHSLRVYCVSKYGNAGMTIAQATAVFGWSTAAMYAHYFKADDDRLSELADVANLSRF